MTRTLRNLSAAAFLIAASHLTTPTTVRADHSCYHAGNNIGFVCRNQYGEGSPCMACAEGDCMFFSMGHPACQNECMGGAWEICNY